MQDIETESLWSQPSGVCIKGEMVGKVLTQFPAIHTTYAQFVKMYPGGVLLTKEEKGDQNSQYAGYFAAKDKLGIFGRVDNFERLGGKDKILGLRIGQSEVAVSLDYLQKNGYALVKGTTPSVIVIFNSEGQTATAFVVETGDEIEALKYVDSEGGPTLSRGDISWDALSGEIVSGSGEKLVPVPVMTAYWFAWASFFPDTQLIQ